MTTIEKLGAKIKALDELVGTGGSVVSSLRKAIDDVKEAYAAVDQPDESQVPLQKSKTKTQTP